MVSRQLCGRRLPFHYRGSRSSENSQMSVCRCASRLSARTGRRCARTRRWASSCRSGAWRGPACVWWATGDTAPRGPGSPSRRRSRPATHCSCSSSGPSGSTSPHRHAPQTHTEPTSPGRPFFPRAKIGPPVAGSSNWSQLDAAGNETIQLYRAKTTSIIQLPVD